MESKLLIYVTEPEFIEVNVINRNLTTAVRHKPLRLVISLYRSNNLEFINFINNNKCEKFTIYIYNSILNGCLVSSIEYNSNNIVNIEIELEMGDITPMTDEVHSQLIARKRDNIINQIIN